MTARAKITFLGVSVEVDDDQATGAELLAVAYVYAGLAAELGPERPYGGAGFTGQIHQRPARSPRAGEAAETEREAFRGGSIGQADGIPQ